MRNVQRRKSFETIEEPRRVNEVESMKDDIEMAVLCVIVCVLAALVIFR